MPVLLVAVEDGALLVHAPRLAPQHQVKERLRVVLGLGARDLLLRFGFRFLLVLLSIRSDL